MLKCKTIITILALIIGNVAPAHAASWTATGSMATARSGHTATMLANGKVLVAGGRDGSTIVNSAEVFDVTTNTWSNAAAMATDRGWHTATLLANGKVLVAGGYYGRIVINGSPVVNSAEVFDLSTNTWSSTAAMASARGEHTATLLANGKVLMTGGYANNSNLNSTEVFDPTTNTWSNTATMANARHSHTATLLANGKVLVAGGYIFDEGLIYLNSAEIFDVTTNTWISTAALSTARSFHTATLLPNGKVLMTGGYANNSNLNSTEVFDPTTNTWSNTAAMANARHSHTATLLANGKVLVSGGYNGNATVNSAEVFDVTTGTWSNTAAMAIPRDSHTATLLANGKVLVTGGWNGSAYVNSAELYTPDAAATTTTLTSSRNPSSLNQSVTFTTKVAATPVPTGTVTFKVDGTTKAATSLNNGQTTYTTTNLTLGNRLIRAEYAGNSTWAASDAQLTQTVSTGADFVITNLSMNPVAPAVNQTFTVRGVVKNTSTVAGVAGNLSLFLDKATAVGCNTTANKVIPIGTLAAAASKAFSVNFTAAVASGTKTLRTFIDSACATVETNESNNQVTKTYTVAASADFVVNGVTLIPGPSR